MERVTIRVPATTANLAAGFDVLGCALGLYNTLSFTPAERLSFSGCDEQYQTTENLAYVAYERVWREPANQHLHPVEDTVFQIRRRLRPYGAERGFIRTLVGYGYQFQQE